MAGTTDSVYRRIARRFGAGLLYTECISAEGVRRLGRQSLVLARFDPEERPIAVQLFGSNTQAVADAAAIIAERFHPEMIDLNCGCPMRRFIARQCGGYLMQDPDLIGRMVESMRAASGLPVSVKLRAGYLPDQETAVEAATAAEAAGAALVAVHARSVRGSKGKSADWDVIGRVKAAVSRIPVIGNGDIRSADDIRKMKTLTGCDRVMIGRWAQGRPWIFASPATDAPEEGFPQPSPAERLALLLEHYRMALAEYPERRAVSLMRKQMVWYTSGLRDSAALKRQLVRLDRAEEAIALLENYQAILSELNTVEWEFPAVRTMAPCGSA
jgi:tRNA-dihydrouridine synthase B